MQPRFLFIPHKDIIVRIIAYIMQLIAELEKSFFFFYIYWPNTSTANFFSLHRVSRWLRKERNVHGKYNFVSRKLPVSL